jgi:hypothetical protein
MTASMRPTSHGRRTWVIVLGAGCVLALAACGSSSKPMAGAATSSLFTAALKYSECMRSHGVPSFPDPTPTGTIVMTASSGINPQSPAFQAAKQACKTVQAAMQAVNPFLRRQFTEAQKLANVKYARCMRAHSVTDYPDPTYSTHNGQEIETPLPGDINQDSPTFTAAEKACAST